MNEHGWAIDDIRDRAKAWGPVLEQWSRTKEDPGVRGLRESLNDQDVDGWLARRSLATRLLPLVIEHVPLAGPDESTNHERIQVAWQDVCRRDCSPSRVMGSPSWWWYPTTLAVLMSLVMALFLIWLIPIFSELFDEFGLQLPLITRVFLELSQPRALVWWIPILMVVIVAMMTFRKWSPLSLSHQRVRIAAWSSDLAFCTSLGLSRSACLDLAGRWSQSRWIRTRSPQWSAYCRRGLLPASALSRIERADCSVLASVWQWSDMDARADGLAVVAANYEDVSRVATVWWLDILSMFLVILIGIVTSLLAIALVAPLVELVSGLT
ncbi:MAG: hypothetical protein AAF670_09515 [Planctomycetota bacterium]